MSLATRDNSVQIVCFRRYRLLYIVSSLEREQLSLVIVDDGWCRLIRRKYKSGSKRKQLWN